MEEEETRRFAETIREEVNLSKRYRMFADLYYIAVGDVALVSVI